MTDTEPDPKAGPTKAPDATDDEAQRAADGLKGQIAALRDQVRKARAELLRERRKKEPRSFED